MYADVDISVVILPLLPVSYHIAPDKSGCPQRHIIFFLFFHKKHVVDTH